jgi:hypothetical protein
MRDLISLKIPKNVTGTFAANDQGFALCRDLRYDLIMNEQG